MEPLTPRTPKELWDYFRLGATVTIKGTTGILSAIEREDGSGLSFNVRFSGQTNWIYVRLSGKKS